jgi:ribosomal protein L32
MEVPQQEKVTKHKKRGKLAKPVLKATKGLQTDHSEEYESEV